MNQLDDQINKAIEILNGGGIVIFPTDTAFGIGCRIDNHEAIDKLFTIRERPLTQATPVLVSSKDMALEYYIEQTELLNTLIDTYWPGALTIVAPCKKELVYEPVRGSGDNIGLRMPNNQTILKIIEGVGVPILGPSANFHGLPTPFAYDELDPNLITLVDFIVEGECDPKKIASTVVDISKGQLNILRQGAVDIHI